MAYIPGTAGSDFLVGTNQDDLINGFQSADYMAGGAGHDRYVVDNTGDVVAENAGQGSDFVSASVSYTLGANVESLRLLGTWAINGTGNALANYLEGNSAGNTLSGGGEDDTLDGKGGADTLIGGTGNDVYYVDNAGDIVIEYASEGYDIVFASNVNHALSANVEELYLIGFGAIGTGNALDNRIYGGGGENELYGRGGSDTLVGSLATDVLDGGTGADTMEGESGDDYFWVDNSGDVVIENSNDGYDMVFSRVDYTLTANVEVLVLEANAVTGIGNDEYNYIYGNSQNNVLEGRAGADVLSGDLGADTMIGGTSSDTYYVDNAGDVVTELANEGLDYVRSTVNHTLAANVEGLILDNPATSGTGNNLDNDLWGNNADNVLTGGDGADHLHGEAGNDTLIGGTGDDVYWITDAAADLTESAGQGIDTVYTVVSYTLTAGADIETLAINSAGSMQAIDLTGNGSGNIVRGNNGTNVINGGNGNDELIGMGGQDVFLFNTALNVTFNIDTLSDFSVADDIMHLDDAIFSTIAPGGLQATQFRVGAAAQDGNDYIIYDSATGALYYDSDGNSPGAAIQFAELAPGLALTNNDFLVV
jgi:Ca2+-binding RTX toxin-like protein